MNHAENAMKKNPRPNIDLPDGFRIDSAAEIVEGETNHVFFCEGEFRGRTGSAYVKASKHPQLNLSNENAVLSVLKNSGIPVPEVIWYGGERNDVLVVEALPGKLIWDYIDPRRKLYASSLSDFGNFGCKSARFGPDSVGFLSNSGAMLRKSDKILSQTDRIFATKPKVRQAARDKALLYLRAYGECLARIHNLTIPWTSQKRLRLYNLIGEEEVDDERFRQLVSWLQQNKVNSTSDVFVHGDYNTASVLFHNDAISGVIDWEFAGSGWREYELAWALRARLSFLNTEPERQAILDGYLRYSTYDEKSLRWCEVLNYLHFAYWGIKRGSDYTPFALDRAEKLAG
jgi:aminoglycoside phosphotransferase